MNQVAIYLPPSKENPPLYAIPFPLRFGDFYIARE